MEPGNWFGWIECLWLGWSFLPSTLQGIYRSNLLIHYSSIPPSTPRVVPLERTRAAWHCQAAEWRVISNADMTEAGTFARPGNSSMPDSSTQMWPIVDTYFVYTFVRLWFFFCECVHVIEALARHNCVVPQLNIETYIHSASLIETFVRRGSMII